MDLSEAFVTINHEMLCEKLHYYCIRDIVLDWVESYLKNRTQFVHLAPLDPRTGKSHVVFQRVNDKQVAGFRLQVENVITIGKPLALAKLSNLIYNHEDT